MIKSLKRKVFYDKYKIYFNVIKSLIFFALLIYIYFFLIISINVNCDIKNRSSSSYNFS